MSLGPSRIIVLGASDVMKEFNKENLHIPGAKEDSNKIDLDLVLSSFALAINEVGKVGTFGAKKYSENGWIKVPNGIRRYRSALLRHFFKDGEGERVDSETNISHLAHAAWNALAVLELTLRSQKEEEIKVYSKMSEDMRQKELEANLNTG